MQIFPPLIAFFSASLITYLAVFNSERFHNFFFLINGQAKLLLYCFSYGILGVGLLYLLKDRVITITEDNTTAGDFLYPFVVGISTKAISELNLLNIKTKETALPIGIKTFTQPIDKYFEELLDGLCFKRSVSFRKPYDQKYESVLANAPYNGNLEKFKAHINKELSHNHPDKTKTGTFEASDDFTKTKDIKDLLSAVLREFGPDVFNAVFPL